MSNDYKNIQETTSIPSSRRLFGGFLGVILGLLISLIVVSNLFAKSGAYVILIIFSTLITVGGVIGWRYYEKTRRSPYAYVYQISAVLIFLCPTSIIVMISEGLYLFFLIGVVLGATLFFLRQQSLIEKLKRQGILKSFLELSETEKIEHAKAERIAGWAAMAGYLIAHFYLEQSAARDGIFVILGSGISMFFTLFIITVIKLKKLETISS